MTTMTGGSEIESQIALYDSDIRAIAQGPIAWHNLRMGSRRNIDDHVRGLTEQFHKIGLIADVQVWTMGQDGVPIEDAYVFKGVITGRVTPESEFDHDRLRHEIVHNLLDIPGEEGTIKFDEQEFLRQHGGGKHLHLP